MSTRTQAARTNKVIMPLGATAQVIPFPKIQGKSRFGFKYNWKRDLPDQRDLRFSTLLAPPEKLPPKCDLRDQCSPVFNQGQIGSCTGNAMAGALEFLELKELKEKSNQSEPFVYDPKVFSNISRLFIYYNERLLEGTTSEDAGANLRDGIKSLNKWGACRETLWNYDPENTFTEPTDNSYQEAQKHKIGSYYKIVGLTEMKQCLAGGFPFAFGFTVYESFESPEVEKTGIMPLPESNEEVLGGHAVLAVGYDDSTNYLIVRNSWGTNWGQKGYFLMPYDYISKLKLADDFWTIRR